MGPARGSAHARPIDVRSRLNRTHNSLHASLPRPTVDLEVGPHTGLISEARCYRRLETLTARLTARLQQACNVRDCCQLLLFVRNLTLTREDALWLNDQQPHETPPGPPGGQGVAS